MQIQSETERDCLNELAECKVLFTQQTQSKVNMMNCESQMVQTSDLYFAKQLLLNYHSVSSHISCSEIIGKFDVIWDRGSLVAIDPPDRSR